MSLIHGADGSSIVRPLLLASDGSMLVSMVDNTSFNPGSVLKVFSNNNLPAGTSVQTVFTVPVGQRYIINHFIYRYVGTVAGVTLIPQVNDTVATYAMARINPPVSATFYEQTFRLVMDAGYSLELSISGATLNDDCLVYAFGERVK